MKCSLCSTATTLFSTYKERAFYKCPNCKAVLLHPDFYLDAPTEKARYDLHSDDVSDKRYQNFVMPLVDVVTKNYTPKAIGLDFGCGKTAIVKYVLEQKGYQVQGYDPIYFKEEALLLQTYDYITSCEVIEHLYKAKESFQLLSNLLRPKGKLILKTSLYDHQTNFEKWWYKNDPTHVIFYSKQTLEYIKEYWGYQSLQNLEKCIVLSK